MSLTLFRRVVFVLSFGLFLGLISPIGAAAVVEQDPYGGGTSQASNIQLAHVLVDRVFNNGDADAAAQLVSDDVVLHTSFGDFTGPEGLLDYISFVERTYVNPTFDIVSARVNGGSVIIDWRMTASGIRVDPVEMPADVDVDITETITLLVENSQIAEIDLDDRVVTLTEPSPDTQVAYDPLPGQPY